MELVDVAVALVVIYFVLTGGLFLLKPSAVAMYELAPIGPAGRTEVRCYYGALALGLGAFMAYLGFQGHGRDAIVGTFLIAAAILATRVAGAFADDGWSERYNRSAVPVEVAFVLLLGGTLLLT